MNVCEFVSMCACVSGVTVAVLVAVACMRTQWLFTSAKLFSQTDGVARHVPVAVTAAPLSTSMSLPEVIDAPLAVHMGTLDSDVYTITTYVL